MYACLMCVIVPRLTSRRRLALQPVKSQGAKGDSSVVIITHDNQDGISSSRTFRCIHLILVYCVLYVVSRGSHHCPRLCYTCQISVI